MEPETNNDVIRYLHNEFLDDKEGIFDSTSTSGKEALSGVDGGDMKIHALCYDKVYRNNWIDDYQDISESTIMQNWISKEISLQELICSEGSPEWPDVINASADDHEIDILSTLAAVVAMFREWLSLEAEVSCQQYRGLDTLNGDFTITNGVCDASKLVDEGLPIQLDAINWSINVGCDIDFQSFHDLGVKHNMEHQNIDIGSPDFKGGSTCAVESEIHSWGTKPHYAFPFIFPYLSLQDIFNLECTCKTLKYWIRSDLPLWQHIHIGPPMSYKFTDEMLTNLASRANGELSCLKVVNCINLTESAVEDIVYSNPKISKLCIPGCIRVSPDAVVRMVAFLSMNRDSGGSKLKQLKLGNMFDLKREHFESLSLMLDDSTHRQPATPRLQYYQFGYPVSFLDDQRTMDVEECPKCSNVRIVYDCTRKSCQQTKACRACTFCILRCEECGRCINDEDDYMETFCLELVCSSCSFRVPECAEQH